MKNVLKDAFFKMEWKVNVEMTLQLELYEFLKSAALSEWLNGVSKQFWRINYKRIYQLYNIKWRHEFCKVIRCIFISYTLFISE